MCIAIEAKDVDTVSERRLLISEQICQQLSRQTR